MDRILLCESKETAYSKSASIYDQKYKEEGESSVTESEEKTISYMFPVHENILSGQFGLNVRHKYWDDLEEEHKENIQISNPLWIDEQFINGESFFMLGSGPFGFGIGNVNPKETRKVLEGNFSKDLIEEIRNSGRNYTIEVQNTIKRIIEDVSKNKLANQAILDQIDPYQFEELIAELLRGQGFDVFLTPKSGDKGRDIIAAFYEKDQPYLMMVECKRRSEQKVLGPVDVRALLGQFYFEKIQGKGFNCAMLVTSAGSIGPTALNMKEVIAELTVKDRCEIMKWIGDYGNFHNNLWVPKQFHELF